MARDYFQLLGVEPGLPEWAMVSELHKAEDRAQEAYGGAIPGELRCALDVLLDDKSRAFYCGISEAAAAKAPVRFGPQTDEVVRHGNVFHFTVVRRVGDDVYFERKNCPDPPPPARGDEAPPSERVLDVSREPETDWAAGADPDAYGCVNGAIPLVHIGLEAYQVGFAEQVVLEHCADYPAHKLLQWVQPGLGNKRFAFRDTMVPLYNHTWFTPGTPFRFTQFTNVETREYHDVALIPNIDGGRPALRSGAYFHAFPVAKKLVGSPGSRETQKDLWEKLFGLGTYPRPARIRGLDGRWTDKEIRWFMHFVRSAFYWTGAKHVGFDPQLGTPKLIREVADEAARKVLWMLKFRDSKVARVEYPHMPLTKQPRS